MTHLQRTDAHPGHQLDGERIGDVLAPSGVGAVVDAHPVHLYVAFAARYDAVVFDHIAMAGSRHLAAVRTLLQRYGATDPTAGQQVERDDIAALKTALNGLTAPDVRQVHAIVLTASERRLAALTRWATR